MSKILGADDDRSEFRTNLSLIKSVRDPADAESWRRFHDFYAPLLMRYLRRLGLEENTGERSCSRMCSSGCCRAFRLSSSTNNEAGSAAISGS